MVEQRLPAIDGDEGHWGEILNQFISKEHYDSGLDDVANGGHQKITIRPGTASAGTAPLKFTSGTLLTTPEAGAMEFAGDNYYLTQTTGTTRKKIAAYDDTSGATGDIYYRNSSGYFTRLGIGGTGNVLTVSGGIPSWSTIGNSSVITVKDANFTLQDDGDTTKQLKFQLSGISASTTRTLTVPDASTTLVGTDTTQTLTNKTLTAPAINNATTLSVGQTAALLTATPANINLGGTYGSNTLGTEGNLKLRVFDDGTYHSGIGFSPARMEYQVSPNNYHTFYVGGVERLTISSSYVRIANVDVVTTTDTQTLTNKTLTSPTINTATSLSVSGVSTLSGGSKIGVQQSVDGGNTRGIFMWGVGDTNWGIYMGTAGTNKALTGNTSAAAGIDGRTSHAIRFRVNDSPAQIGFLWENNSEQALMQLTGDTGNLYTKGDVYVGNSTTNKVVTLTGTETLTNKTISGSSNTLSDIAQSSITGLTDDLALSTSWFARQSSSQINLASDPNCSDPLAWVSCGSVWSPSVITSEQHSGTSCLEMTVLAANYASADFVRSVDGKNLAANSADYQASAMKVRSGDKFYAEIWVKTDAANTGPIPQFYIQFWSTDSNIGYSSYSFTNVGGTIPVAGVWTKISGSYTIPAGKDRLEVRVATGLMVSSNIGDVFFLDDMALFNITESQDIIDTIYQGINGGSATLKSLADMKTSVETLVTKTGTQTLTNKTLTSPRIGTSILDTNGAKLLDIASAASAVNYIRIGNRAAGLNPYLLVEGSDTNIDLQINPKGSGALVFYVATGQHAKIRADGADANHNLNLIPKGTGTVQANGVDVVTTTGTQTLTNKTISASNNTISNIAVSNLAASAVVTTAETIAANNNDTTIPTSAAVKSYVDSTGSGDASTNTATSVDSEVAVFSGTTGKLLKRATGSGIAKLTSGVLSTVTAPSGTIVGTTDAQTLTNKTISTSTIVGPVSMDSPGALTVVDASLVNANFAIASNMGAYPAYNAFSKYLWHDLLRFSRWTGAPTYETYASGSWGAQTLNTLIFSGKEATAYTLVDGTTATGVRWTWHSGNLAYSYLRWWVIGFAYTNPAQVNDVLVESSTDGVSWTTRHTSTTTANAVPAWFAASDHGAAYYLRLTITTANAQPIRISSIKGLSARWGDQGGGSEQEYPYEWDGSRNITIGSSGARSDGALNVGDTSATTAAEGIYFGNDTNLYRSAANTLKTDDNLAIGTSTQTPTATPANINLGGTYGNNTVGTQGNLKLRLYDNGSGSNHFGLGISDSKLEYQVPNGSGHHFYVNGVERLKITNSVFQIAGADVVTTTGTQTLTNKTLTSPKADQILDTNGAVSIYLYARPSAVNYASINNGVTGGDVQYSVNGTDANINIGLRPKGTGMVWIQDSGASGIARFRNNTGVTNWWDFTSEGSATDISARAGGEANVGIDLVPKGTGTVKAGGIPVVTTTGTQTLTNKTISGSSNTLSNIPQSAVTSLTTDLASIATNVELTAKSSNLIPDPNFEDNTVTRYGYGSVVPTYTSADAFQGTNSLTWTSTSSTWQGPYFSPVQSGKKRFVCNPGETFRVKLKIKPDASNNMTVGYVRIFMRFWTTATSGTYTDRAAGTYAINNTSMAAGWQDMDCFGICPTEKGALEVFVINDPATTNGNIYYIDCVTIEQVSYGQEVVDAAVQAIAGGSTTGYSIANLKTNMQSLVTLTGTQTLTNKTLTSPTINTATLSGATSVTGNLTVDNGTSTLIDVISDDTGSSGIRLIGNSQGTGYIEVGQSTQYGGGMYYNGDGSPAFATGESADTIGFYRNNNNARSEVFYYSYANDNVYFNGSIYSGGVAIPTISSTDTLTNKTISGSSNTLSNIPADAVPDAARKVRSHGTTANEWYKVFTFTPPASDYVRLNMMLAISGFTGGGAIIQISLGNTSTGNANASVEYIAKGYTPMLDDDSFKIVSDGYGQPFELWVKTVNTNGGVCSYYEISRYGGPAYLTYDTGNTHTPTEPTGSSINVYSAGMVNNAVPVVNTTATQTLTNKTLTSPVLSTASTALTVGTGSAGTTTPSRIVFENAYATNTPGSNANQKIQLYSGYGFGVSASTLEYQTNTGAVHKFFVGGTERLTISTSDVTIGGASVATTTGTQTLTNKTISLANNTLTTTLAQLNTAISDATLIKPTSIFNNMGDVHTTRTSFDAQGAASTVDFGWRFVQGNTNGPGTNGAAQYYSALIGLGEGYAFNNYAMQIAYPRNVTNPYISIRYQEGGSFGAWQKISAGNADTATALATARTIQTNLASTSSASFNGTANITPGVTGTLPVANGGTGATTLTGIVKGNGTGAFTAVTAPSGTIVGTTDTQTLTNKTISGSSNTLSNIAISSLSATGTPSASTYLRGDGTWAAAGGGDASTNTATSVDSEVVLFSGTGGKTLKRATGSGIAKLTSGVLSVVTAPSGTIVGTTDTQTLTNKTLTNPTVNNYIEGVVAIGTVTTTHTFVLTNGTVQTATLTASTACTFTMPTAIAGKSFTLFLKQAISTGNGTATFTGVKWNSAGAPTITATAGKMDILFFTSDGTNWYGTCTQGFTP